MSAELAKTARESMKRKAHSMAEGDPHAKVDASSWTPPEQLETEAKTGLRPISRRQYKKGGKVEGEHAEKRADRKPRKAGGRLADDFINRDVRAANEEREGTKHVGGFKAGGRTKRDVGGPLAPPISNSGQLGSFNYPGRKDGGRAHGDEAQDKALMHKILKPADFKAKGGSVEIHHSSCKCAKCHGGSVSDGELEGTRPAGGREARAIGGDIGSPVGYHVVDRHTGDVVGKFKNGVSASRMVDRRDNDYGASRYSRRPIWADHAAASDFAPKMARKHGGRADAKWIEHADMHKGALHRELHVPGGEKISAKKLDKAEHSPNKMLAKRADLAATLKGLSHREHHAKGGKTGKTNINIVIAPGGDKPAAPMMGGPAPLPPPHPMMPPPGVGGPPPMPPPGMNGAPPMPPGGAPMMPRKRGGKVHMEAGAGSGLGRLEKVEEYGDRA